MKLRTMSLAFLLLVSTASAQDPDSISVRVTGVASGSVFLDAGRSSGLEPGTVVRLFPPGSQPIEVTVRVVSTDGARADLVPGAALPPIGTPGEFERRAVSGAPARIDPRRVDRTFEDLPWPSEDQEFDPDGPLLAPVAGTAPERRPVDWRGRLFGSFVASHEGGGGSNDYFAGRLGSRVFATNLLGNAGEFELAFDVDRRGTDLADSGDGSHSRARLERFSYTYGLASDDPYRLQIGRFYSRSTPELGLLDGAELTARLQNGLRVGAFAGALPRPFPAHATGEDTAASVFVEFGGERPLDVHGVVAFQKSWHRGAADRDLLVGRLFATPTEHLTLHAQAKIDLYTSGDSVKGSGVGLTESFTTLRYRPSDRWGASVSHSHFEYVESDRREYENLPPDLLRDGRNDRFRLSAWTRLGERVRLRASGTAWDDQDRDGSDWDLTAEFDGVVEQETWLAVSVFEIDGSYQSGHGLRFDARRRFGDLGVRAGYTARRLDTDGLLFGESAQTSQSARIGADWHHGSWQYSLSGDAWFGDREDAYSISLFAQYRF